MIESHTINFDSKNLIVHCSCGSDIKLAPNLPWYIPRKSKLINLTNRHRYHLRVNLGVIYSEICNSLPRFWEYDERTI